MKIVKVTCAIVQHQNNTLVVQRGRDMKLPLKWEFAGGKIEALETEENCIIREIKEELNIQIELISRLTPSIYKYAGISIELIPFLANYVQGEIKLLEHRQHLWLPKHQLHKLDWSQADIPILKEYLNL